MKEIDDEDVRAYLEGLVADARTDMIPKMKSSLFVLAVLSGDPDIQLALQVGMALLLDKPLLIISIGNVWIPARVRQMADLVVEGAVLDDDMKERTRAAIDRFLTGRKRTQ